MSFRIAILEGDADILEGRRLLLDAHNELVIVYEQSNAVAAIDEIAQQLVDLIVIDLRLQGMDGVAAAKAIAARFRDTEQKVPAMILTAPFSNPELVDQAKVAGIAAVVSVADGSMALIEAIESSLTL